MLTTASGVVYSEVNDAANMPSFTLSLATALEPMVAPAFSSNTTRDAAITAPTNGKLAYRQDANELDVYHGGAARFVPIGMQLIAEAVGTGSTITFNNIPQTYRHLRVVCTTTGSIGFRINNDSGSNYNNTYVGVAATPTISSTSNSGTSAGPGFGNGTYTALSPYFEIMNYTLVATKTVYYMLAPNGGNTVTNASTTYNVSTAVTRLDVPSTSGVYVAIYGVG